ALGVRVGAVARRQQCRQAASRGGCVQEIPLVVALLAAGPGRREGRVVEEGVRGHRQARVRHHGHILFGGRRCGFFADGPLSPNEMDALERQTLGGSSTNSSRTPWVSLGWTKAMRLFSTPRRGSWSIMRTP